MAIYGHELDPQRCKKIVRSGRLGLIENQCKRKIWRDRFCWQHHPENIRKREEISAKRLEAKPLYLLIRPSMKANDC